MKIGDRRGQARIVEGLIAITIILVGATSAVYSVALKEGYAGVPRGLDELASSTLSTMLRSGVLADAVYKLDASTLKARLEALLPAGVGYDLSVYDANWNLMTKVEHGYKPTAQTGSAVLILVSNEGQPVSPRIVVLNLAR